MPAGHLENQEQRSSALNIRARLDDVSPASSPIDSPKPGRLPSSDRFSIPVHAAQRSAPGPSFSSGPKSSKRTLDDSARSEGWQRSVQQRIADTSSGDEVDAPAAHQLVMVTSGNQTRRVLVAEMNAGLVVASRSESHEGIYSQGFAVCLAIVLQSRGHVALAHTSNITDEHFNEEVEKFRATFIREARLEQGVVPCMSVGYSSRGRQAECEMHPTVQKMMEAQPHGVDFEDFKKLGPNATEKEQWKAAIKCILGHQRESVTQWAAKTRTPVFDMPYGLRVPLDGDDIEIYTHDVKEEEVPSPEERR